MKKQFFSWEIDYLQRILFLAVVQISVSHCQAQYYEEKPDPEIGIGIKVVKGEILYGSKPHYVTDTKSISLQALVRYGIPVKISSISPYQQRYIDFVIESGFLFCKAKVFDTVLVDNSTNELTHEKSKSNPGYLPVYAGLYNRSAFSIGAAVFYWKGLGVKDLWGTKFLSLGYNGYNFRITASGEWYAQTQNVKHNGTIFSFDFVWKLIIKD